MLIQKIKLTIGLCFVLLSVSPLFAAGSMGPAPLVETDEMLLRGTGMRTGCTDEEYERADARTRAYIRAVRADTTRYVEYVTYRFPRTAEQILQISEDAQSLILTIGFSLTRCDEVDDNYYEALDFPHHASDAVVAHPHRGFTLRNDTQVARYLEQSAELQMQGLVQLDFPFETTLSRRERRQLESDGVVSGTLHVFHAVTRRSEININPFERDRWIHVADRNHIASPNRLRRVIPHIVIDYEISIDKNDELSVQILGLSSKR